MQETYNGPPGRSSRRNILARGPNKLFAGGEGGEIVATLLTYFFCSSIGVMISINRDRAKQVGGREVVTFASQ